jgi:hypothetical protein
VNRDIQDSSNKTKNGNLIAAVKMHPWFLFRIKAIVTWIRVLCRADHENKIDGGLLDGRHRENGKQTTQPLDAPLFRVTVATFEFNRGTTLHCANAHLTR